MPPLFHLAIPVNDLQEARDFYKGILGCREGRSSEKWVDLDFFGHQVTLHLRPEECSQSASNPVDGDDVPVRHFGVILDWDLWHEHAKTWSDSINFVIPPRIRFKGQVGEQATMFFLDPSRNALEFKAFKDPKNVFATTKIPPDLKA